jgi:aspartate carbamoyltransferase catalytic subunit
VKDSKKAPYLLEFDTDSQVKDSYLITPETLIKAKPGMVVMHPLPRVNEIRFANLHSSPIIVTIQSVFL